MLHVSLDSLYILNNDRDDLKKSGLCEDGRENRRVSVSLPSPVIGKTVGCQRQSQQQEVRI
jgi:hypothetical protein